MIGDIRGGLAPDGPTPGRRAGVPGVFRLGARQGEPFWSRGTVTMVKAAPGVTGGRLTVVEQLLVAGHARPPRVDPAGDEVLYVLDGIVDVLAGGKSHTLEPGAMLFVPRGQPYCLRVLSNTARTLLFAAPADDAVLAGLVVAG